MPGANLWVPAEVANKDIELENETCRARGAVAQLGAVFRSCRQRAGEVGLVDCLLIAVSRIDWAGCARALHVLSCAIPPEFVF